MNRLYTLVLLFSTLFLSVSLTAQLPMNPDSVIMGPGYAYEIYYAFQTGTKTEVPRQTWDIAFRTMIMSSCIITNDGSDVVLWSYPASDTSGWNTLDTSGLSTWTPMYNDPADWENGAFSRNATGHPDYGWGIYNMGTHILTGDSLFVIRLTDGSFKKLWMVEKDSPQNIYSFRYANLDGSDAQDISIDCNGYLNKEFIGFNMQTNLPVDYQPAKTTWDVLFTKYMSIQPNGEPYPVTGVLSNPEVSAKKYYPVDPEYTEWGVLPWDSSRSAIGWDWKTIDMTQMVYTVKDSMVFFVKDLTGDVYRLKFTEFQGISTGKILFGTYKISSAAIGDSDSAPFTLSLYPNPASAELTIRIDGINAPESVPVYDIRDLSGRILLHGTFGAQEETTAADIRSLSPGIYFVVVTVGDLHYASKLLKR